MARTPNRLASFRQRIPADLLAKAKGRIFTFTLPGDGEGDAILIQAKAGAVIGFSLRTAERTQIVRRQGAALEQFQTHVASLRGGEVELSHRHRHALAGVIYKEFSHHFADDPRHSSQTWEALAIFMKAEIEQGGVLSIPTPSGITNALETHFGAYTDL